jgi:hypothetical protein
MFRFLLDKIFSLEKLNKGDAVLRFYRMQAYLNMKIADDTDFQYLFPIPMTPTV